MVAFIVAHQPLFSQTTWTGSTDTDWHKDCNWNTNAIPTCTDDVVIPDLANDPDITGIAHCRTIEIQGATVIDLNSTGGARLDVGQVGGCSGVPTNNGGCCTVPGATTANAATSITDNAFRANWSLVGGATTYFLDVSTNSSFSSFVTGFNNFNTGNISFKAVSGLSCGTTYYYRVRASNACGTSGNSNTRSVTTTGTSNPFSGCPVGTRCCEPGLACDGCLLCVLNANPCP